MTADPTGLARLHDIVLRAPAPWWPPAPGWYWVLGLACLIGSILLVRALVRWQRNCYRREALAELARIEAMANTGPPATMSPDAALPAMAELLKRTALTAYPRAQVAGLTGPAWFAFLDQTGGTRFSAGLGAALAHGNYLTGDGTTTATHTAEIAGEIRSWIRQHGDRTDCEPANAMPPALQRTTDNGQADAA